MAGPKPGPPAEITKALNAIAPMTNRRYIRTWIGNDKGEDGKTRVTLLWEPLPPTPGVRRDDPRRVTVLATSPSGDIVYRGKVPTELATPGNGGIIRFQAPPGKLEMRLTIEGDGTGTLDTEDRDLVVPDLSAPEVMLSTPQRVVRAQRARVHRAHHRHGAGADRDPRVPPHRPPAGAPRRLRAGQRADLHDRAAAESAGHEDDRCAGESARRRRCRPYSIDLALASFAAGQYLLEITANSEGHKPVSELVAFRLGS